MKFVIVGKKEGFITADKEVLDLVEKINICENSVFFTGNVNDLELYAWYKGATALIFPSYYEGFGLPIIEAMQFGLPIICSDIPVFREIGKDKSRGEKQGAVSGIFETFYLCIKQKPCWHFMGNHV